MTKAGPTYLMQLQEGAFSRLKVSRPAYDMETFLATKQRNLGALAQGGRFEAELAKALEGAYLGTGIAAAVVAQMGATEEHVDDRSYQNVVAAWNSRPTPYEHPTTHFLLTRCVDYIMSAGRIYPEFQLEELFKRVTVGTLSTVLVHIVAEICG